MQKIIKIIIIFIFLFVVGIFYISLTRDTNYNTSSLINKELMIIQKFVGPLSADDYNNIIKIIE